MALDPAPGRQTARPTAHLCGRLFIESSRRGSRAPPDAFLPAESPARPTQRAHSARLIPPQTLAKTGDGRAAAPCATAKPQNHDGYRRPLAEGRGPRAGFTAASPTLRIRKPRLREVVQKTAQVHGYGAGIYIPVRWLCGPGQTTATSRPGPSFGIRFFFKHYLTTWRKTKQ